MKTIVASVVLCACAAIVSIPGLANAQTKLGNGAMCSPHSPGPLGSPGSMAANDLCQSGICNPGPAKSGEDGAWYCMASTFNCALPDADGGRFDHTIQRGGSTYTCRAHFE